MSKIDSQPSLEQSLSKENMQNPANVLLQIVDLSTLIDKGEYSLSKNHQEELSNIKKALDLGIKLVAIRQDGDSVVTSDDFGERYSLAMYRDKFYLYKKHASESSEDGKRDQWEEVFRGNSNKLEEISDKNKIIEATIELGTALLAVLDQLKASKSA